MMQDGVTPPGASPRRRAERGTPAERRSAVRSPAAVCALALFVALGACSDSSPEGVATTVAPTTTIASPDREDDGVLRIGLLVPSEPAVIADSLEQAARSALDDVNAAGGVLGADVELEVAVVDDSATEVAAAVEAFASSEMDIDAFVGPVSSNTAVAALNVAVEAEVVACTATATALDLSDFPDDGLFFRAIPSDALHAVAIADRVERTGAVDAVVIHVDDPFGRGMAAEVVDALSAREISVRPLVAVSSRADDVTPSIEAIGDEGSAPDAAIVVADAIDGAAVLDALDRSDVVDGSVLVNDAVREAVAEPTLAELSDGFRSRIEVIAPTLVLRDDGAAVASGVFETGVEDCVNLIALAARQGGSDASSTIAAQMPTVSFGGSPCRTFEQCAERIEQGLQINYNGRTGLAELDRSGETSRADFDAFTVDADGRTEFASTFTVEA